MTDTTFTLTIDELTSIYLDGFCSGVATFATNAQLPTVVADEIANSMASRIRDSEEALAELRNQIQTRIANPDGGGEATTVIISARESTPDCGYCAPSDLPDDPAPDCPTHGVNCGIAGGQL